MRKELQLVLEQAVTLTRAELPRLLGDLEEVRAIALARLTSPTTESRPDELLDVSETSKRLHVSRDYLYRNHRKLGFARRLGRKLLFSSTGIDLYLKRAR